MAYTNAVHSDEMPPRAVLRIALPAFLPALHRTKGLTGREDAVSRREEFKRLLEAALDAKQDWLPRYSRHERRQIAMTRKLRAALYGTGRG